MCLVTFYPKAHPSTMTTMARLSYKEQIQRVREDAIVEAVNRLLATKGYDAMTVDEVAAEAVEMTAFEDFVPTNHSFPF